MKIVIKNISGNVTADSLSVVFSTYGNVSSCDFVRPERSAGSSKTAHLIMPDENEAVAAIEQLDGSFVGGQMLTVKPLPAKGQVRAYGFYHRLRTFLSVNGKS